MKEHKDEFKESFDENKKIVEKYTTVSNKKLRNKIAGYATKLTKKKEEE
jgi:small subunit ribosomal protein S17e